MLLLLLLLVGIVHLRRVPEKILDVFWGLRPHLAHGGHHNRTVPKHGLVGLRVAT